MPLDLPHLDERTRQFMLTELDADVAAESLYRSPQLSETGLGHHQRLLRVAIQNGTEESFAEALGAVGAVRPPSRWQHPKEVGLREAHADATFRIAEREFHRFYIRGLCCRALEQGIDFLVIYRARPADPGRAPANSMIGLRIFVRSLLEDVRDAFRPLSPHGLPRCRDPGLSVRLPDDQRVQGDDGRRVMRTAIG